MDLYLSRPAILTSAVVLLIGLRLYQTRHRLRTPKLQGPPRSSLLFGVSQELFQAPDIGALYGDWEKQHGAVYQIPSSLGSKMLVLGDPKGVAHFFSKDTVAYHQLGFLRVFSRQFFGDILLVMEGETHKRQRRAVSSAFSISAIRNLTPYFLDSAHKLASSWDASINSQKQSGGVDFITTDVQKWMNYISLDSVGNGGFAHDFGSLDGRHSPVMDALDSFGSIKPSLTILLIFLLGPLFPSYITSIPNERTSATAALSSGAKEIAQQLMARAAIEKETNGESVDKSILGTLVRAENASANVQMSLKEIEAQVILFMLAGYETTATTLTWALIELCREPEVQERLRAELQEYIADGEDATYEQLTHDLPYLDAFTCEVLRLHPPAPEIMREANEDDTIPLATPITTASGEIISNLPVAKGTFLRIPIAAVNRSEALWGPDAATFNPGRWLEDQSHNGGSLSPSQRKTEIQGYRHLLSFAAGPRMCVGRNFALTEFKAVLSVLIRRFSFELPNGPNTEIGQHRSIGPRPKVVGEDGPRVPIMVRTQ